MTSRGGGYGAWVVRAHVESQWLSDTERWCPRSLALGGSRDDTEASMSSACSGRATAASARAAGAEPGLSLGPGGGGGAARGGGGKTKWRTAGASLDPVDGRENVGLAELRRDAGLMELQGEGTLGLEGGGRGRARAALLRAAERRGGGLGRSCAMGGSTTSRSGGVGGLALDASLLWTEDMLRRCGVVQAGGAGWMVVCRQTAGGKRGGGHGCPSVQSVLNGGCGGRGGKNGRAARTAPHPALDPGRPWCAPPRRPATAARGQRQCRA